MLKPRPKFAALLALPLLLAALMWPVARERQNRINTETLIRNCGTGNAPFPAPLLVIKNLLANGADVNARSQAGWTALQMAAKYPVWACGEYAVLEDDVAPLAPNSPARRGRYVVIELLLRHGADVNARAENGETALMLAAQGGIPEVVDLLLKHGADPNARDSRGQTAVQLAHHSMRSYAHGAEQSFPRVIHLLRAAGARE